MESLASSPCSHSLPSSRSPSTEGLWTGLLGRKKNKFRNANSATLPVWLCPPACLPWAGSAGMVVCFMGKVREGRQHGGGRLTCLPRHVCSASIQKVTHSLAAGIYLKTACLNHKQWKKGEGSQLSLSVTSHLPTRGSTVPRCWLGIFQHSVGVR